MKGEQEARQGLMALEEMVLWRGWWKWEPPRLADGRHAGVGGRGARAGSEGFSLRLWQAGTAPS